MKLTNGNVPLRSMMATRGGLLVYNTSLVAKVDLLYNFSEILGSLFYKFYKKEAQIPVKMIIFGNFGLLFL